MARLGVVTETTGVARDCVDWELLILCVFKSNSSSSVKGGIIPLLEGGMTTRKSGFRLFIPRLPPGGGGDLVGITFPSAFPPAGPSRLGEALGFTNPLPTGLAPAPFGTEMSDEHNITPAFPVLEGLCDTPGDTTFRCSDV